MPKLCVCGNLRVCLVTCRNKPDVRAKTMLGLNTTPCNVIRRWFTLRKRSHFLKVSTSNAEPAEVRKVSGLMSRDNAMCACGSITTVVIAHDVGAECVVKALKELESEDKKMSREYRKQMALFVVGGNDFLRKNVAEVSINFYFQNDFFTASLLNHYQRIKPRLSEQYDIREIGPFTRYSRWVGDARCSCCSNGRQEDDCRTRHAIKDVYHLCDYVRCGTLKEGLQTVLS